MAGVASTLAKKRALAAGFGTNANAVPHLNQNFEALRAQQLSRGALFCDPAFPAAPESLGFNELGPASAKTRGVTWKRPGELCSRPEFIVGGATRTDICQGALGDCWLLAAIASLTLNDDVMARVVPRDQGFGGNYAGIFHFQFWQYGEWVDVVIDDRLPVKNGELMFVHSAEGSEFWSALLEKAYAKVNGCYEALSGGSTSEGFEDFTGGIAESYELKKAPPNMFQIIKMALDSGALLGCSIDITSAADSEAITRQKLVKGHAYSLTGAVEVNYCGQKQKLVRMRNPWGQVEWTGAWSDGSPEWKRVDPSERPDHDAEDGEFWMSFQEFLSQYSRIEICTLTPDTLTSDKVKRWAVNKFDGSWRKGSTAGGCRNNAYTFWMNPQFVVKLEDSDSTDNVDSCSFVVGLIQKNRRKLRKMGEDMNTIGFAIYECHGQGDVHLDKNFFLTHGQKARSETFINLREVSTRFHLPAGEYLIVPSTFEPNQDGDFCLRVFSERETDAQLCEDPVDAVIPNETVSDSEVDPSFRALFAKLAGSVNVITWWTRMTLTPQQSSGDGKLGLGEFATLWKKIQRYLVRQQHTHTHTQTHTASLILVARYAEADMTIDFDNFVACLLRLEMMFGESRPRNQEVPLMVHHTLLPGRLSWCPLLTKGDG
uniref:Calpain catalytic domain-containing protein n=1 Tax=Denticeps clupeoides TaxID=299321 RepID=A0AAY4A6J2_9TELE